MAVVLGYETIRIVSEPQPYPVFSGELGLPPILGLALIVILVTPVALHLVVAIQTVILMMFVPNRAPISATVQVYAYAIAPCLFAGLPLSEIRAASTIYGAIVLVLGIAIVHRVSVGRALFISALPGALVFGYGFRGFEAIATVLRNWYII